mmetsp:Transcript_32974/g.37807  ORF Transcript_32974/g.37807 Transcript_32974/m.37807 type:complete len:181 (-) Transcript_32974:135-677(-)
MMYDLRNKSRAAAGVAVLALAASTHFGVDIVDAVNHVAVKEASENNPAFGRSVRALQQNNRPGNQQTQEIVKASFDYFDPNEDRCDNSAHPTEDRPLLEECDFSKFPSCDDDEDICYNRKPSRDHFYKDNHQHKFYIQYDRVFCYPSIWGGCSSCTPGRYCRSEKRCILEEMNYPCEEWF